jgi:hypothetical protein
MAPSSGPRGANRERQQPREAGPGEQHGRDSCAVVEEVWAQLVGENRDEHSAALPVERAQQEMHSRPCDEQQRAEPDSLSEPIRAADGLEEPVEGTHRPEVTDVLVGDRPERDVAVPKACRIAQHASRIEIEIRLRVGAHSPGTREHHREVGDPRRDQQHTMSPYAGHLMSHRPARPRQPWPRVVAASTSSVL